MLILNDMKKRADVCLTHAKAMLTRDGLLAPVVIPYNLEGEPQLPVALQLTCDADRKAIPDILWELSLTSSYLIVILQGRYKESEDGLCDVSDLDNDQDATDTLLVAVYGRGCTSVKPILFKREGKGMPAFIDRGWCDFNEGGVAGFFRNPFIN